ncbi:hypothetical protein QZH41_008975, partial [Actinostola sp. cb2023]
SWKEIAQFGQRAVSNIQVVLNVVCGTGYYVDNSIPEATGKVLICRGTCQYNGQRGDCRSSCRHWNQVWYHWGLWVSCSWPLTSFEKKYLQAAAMAQADTGAPVMIHPGRDEYAPFEIIRMLQEAGGDISKTVITHLDRTIFDHKMLLDLAAATGCYFEYDLFGTELVHYDRNPAIDMPSDSQLTRN